MANTIYNSVAYPLITSSLSVARTLWHKFKSTSLPKDINYPIDNKIHIGNIKIPIGVNIFGEVEYLLIGGEFSHTYVVGQTGAGKSNIVKVILATLVNNYAQVQLILLDYKRVELSLFKDTQACINFKWEEDEISKSINDLYTLVLARYDELAEQGLTVAPLDMPPIVCIIEEISLMPRNDMKILRKIMAISRAVNVFIIFTTQRPSNEILDNVVKSLVANRICLKTDDRNNSMIALDSFGCEVLNGKGHGLFKCGGNVTEFQSYHITDTLVKDICYKRRKTHLNAPRNVPKPIQDVTIGDESWVDLL